MKSSFAGKKRGGTLLSGEKYWDGLCVFCYAAPHCILVNSRGKLVLECEEFRVYDPTREEYTTEKNVVESGPSEGARSVCERSENFANNGLCGDCAIYDSCPFPRNRGEVWCCEEYR